MRIRTFIHRRFRVLHGDQSGVAMTEFVITLPAFIIIFVALVNMWKLEGMYTRTRFRAATNMWQAAMGVHNDGHPGSNPHMLPPTAAADAMGNLGDSYAGDGPAMIKNTQMLSNGSQGEGEGATTFISGAPSSAPGPTMSTFPEDIIDDQFMDPLTSASGPFVVFVPAMIASFYPGTRHAIALGTRYGMVRGEDFDNVNLFGQNFSFEANYDVLVSPVSVPANREIIVVGMSRLAAEDDPCLSSVLEVSNDGDFDC